MEENQIQKIPDSFEDFMKDVPDVAPIIPDPPEPKSSMEERFAEERIKWKLKIDELSTMMKKIENMAELQATIYTDRQRAVEYYYYLLSLVQKINKTYRKQYDEKYDYYTYKSQKRFPNERGKEIHILVELQNIFSKKEILENHSKFMENTIKSIDQIIYGIKYRIEYEQIMRGK